MDLYLNFAVRLSKACPPLTQTSSGTPYLAKGARIYCENCKKSMLLPFSCKGRWFCPSCHLPAPKRLRQAGQKKVLLFGEFITGTIAFPVPHRQYVFSLPIMPRKMVYNAENGTVIYRSRMHAKTKRKSLGS